LAGDHLEFPFNQTFETHPQACQAMINTQLDNVAVMEPARAHGRLPSSSPARSAASFATAADISPEAVRAELQRILASEDFRASERNRRVLQFIVDCMLEGREAEISAFNIATRVYGRGDDFDPVRDPIVRIEMARLRRDLEMYYLKSGARNLLRVTIPKGRYFARFHRVTPTEAAASGAASRVSPFLLSVMRAALCCAEGRKEEAAAAWQDLLLANPSLVANLHESVEREVGDAEVARMLVDGVFAAAGRQV